VGTHRSIFPYFVTSFSSEGEMKHPQVKDGHRQQIRDTCELSVGVLSISGFRVIKLLIQEWAERLQLEACIF